MAGVFLCTNIGVFVPQTILMYMEQPTKQPTPTPKKPIQYSRPIRKAITPNTKETR